MIFFRSLLLFFMAYALSIGGGAFAGDNVLNTTLYPHIQEVTRHDCCDFVEVKLHNGMVVYLKSTPFDQGEAQIQFLAPGGYNSLNRELRPTGRMAARMVWQSGVGDYLGDRLPCFLYEYSIEMVPTIEGFSRQIHATVPKENIEKALELVNLTFTKPQYTEKEGMAIIARQEETIRQQYYDYDFIFKDMSYALNSDASTYLKPMTIRAVKKVKSNEVLNIFKRGFSNPAEFKAVIIGDLDIETLLTLVDKHLGSLAGDQDDSWPHHEVKINFPKGKHEEVVPGKIRPETMTRMTFPVKLALKEENFQLAQFFVQAVEYQLREVVRREIGQNYSIDAALELPLYPHYNEVWFTIQYAVPKNLSPKVKAAIFKELERLKQEGLTSTQLAAIRGLQKRTDDFWLKDNQYWQSMILNYAVWQWNPEKIICNYDEAVNLDDPSTQKALQNFINLDNYTTITTVD